jgi:beta-glucosidase
VSGATAGQPLYKDATRTPVERARDLLSRMTLEEKVAQMVCLWHQRSTALIDERGHFDAAKARAHSANRHGLGQVARPSDAAGGKTARENAVLANDIQRFFVEETRLGIPVIVHEECLHGQWAPEGTSFPQPIGLAGTFDPDLVERLYAMAAAEARTRGAHQALTPVVDVAREPRWGRVEETFGEDPYLVSRMGVAAVRGFQGDRTYAGKRHVLATLKHFAAHGQPESGTNCAPVNVSMRILREVFLAPFKAAVQEAGAESLMASYNEVDGVPSHANRWLLEDVLRKEWGFRGFVVSDYWGINEVAERPDLYGHHLARDKKEAAALSAAAGVNIELPDADCYLNLVELVREGTLPESLIDARVEPMLEAKFRLGLFDDPYVDPDAAERIVRDPAHRELALEAARKTITLLRNAGGVLPLDPRTIRTIAVIGPNADRVMLGGYSGVPLQASTVLQGIRERVPPGIEVLYHEGCRITVGGSWNQDEVTRADPAENRRMIREAVAVAQDADVIVLAIGDNEQTSREAWAANHMGDRPSLDLVGEQSDLAAALALTGKPVVVLLFSGRPASIPALDAAAILELWYLGQETGQAVAEALFGDINPGGKLPITIPRSVGHVPAYYNHKPSARRGYLFDTVEPLYPFGYGLSYTTFRIGNVRLEHASIEPGGSTRVLADVTNSGTRPGDEVVQLYIRDVVSSVTRPVKELKGFERVSLQPGETRTVAFDVTPDHLAFYDIGMQWRVEPGEFRVMVGSSSRDEDLQTVTLRVTGDESLAARLAGVART